MSARTPELPAREDARATLAAFEHALRREESRPAFARGRVVFGGVDGRVHAVDAASGGPAWRTELGADITAPVVVAGDYVYALASDGLRALRLSDGEIVWSFLSAGRDDATNSPPAVAGGMVFVAWQSLWALVEGEESEGTRCSTFAHGVSDKPTPQS